MDNKMINKISYWIITSLLMVILIYIIFSISYWTHSEKICLKIIPEYCEYSCPYINGNQTIFKKIVDYETSNYEYFVEQGCLLNCSGSKYYVVNCSLEYNLTARIN